MSTQDFLFALAVAALVGVILVLTSLGCSRNQDRSGGQEHRDVGGAKPQAEDSPPGFEPADAATDSQRSVTLQSRVKEGDSFRFESAFTTQPKKRHYTVRIVKVTDAAIHVANPDDPDDFIAVMDRRGYAVDFLDLKSGRSIKDELPEDVWDISNRLIFPDRAVKIGETWEADNRKVRVTYRMVRTGTLRGCEVAEIHATSPGYTGPIRFWVELVTGVLMRQQYEIHGTKTVTERL